MKAIVHKLDVDTDIILVPFWDLHIGSPKCSYEDVVKRINYVKNTTNAYCILGGDLINNSTCDSVGDTYAEPLTPQQQINKCIELFTPISDKILGMCSGNHEQRTYRKSGVDICQCIAAGLGITDRYDATSGVIFLQFGSRTTSVDQDGNINKNFNKPIQYTIYFAHGTGSGGRLIGSKVNGVEKRAQIVDTDIVMQGHTHQPFIAPISSFTVNNNTCTIKQHWQWLVNTDATLNYEEYAETVGMRPTAKAIPRLVLSSSHKSVTGILN